MKFIYWVDVFIGNDTIGRFGFDKEERKFAIDPDDPKWKDACENFYKYVTSNCRELAQVYKRTQEKNHPPVYFLTELQRWFQNSGRIGVSALKQNGGIKHDE